MIKREELKSGCIAKAADDEPVFVLRAQDMLAPALVELWATLVALESQKSGTYTYHMYRKVEGARELAMQMRAWPTRKMPD